jgi:hypothetical protein
MKNELNLSVVSENGTVTILEGKALEQKEQRTIDINGILNNPAEWLGKRLKEIDPMQAHVIVNREQLSIRLVTEEKSHYATKIGGALQLHPDFAKFGINSGEYSTAFDMAHFFKMNRSCFENHNEAMNLVAQLQNFKAKVNKALENSDNNRGDRKVLIEQTVKSNLPELFTLNIPIFKGQLKETFQVEVYVRAEDLTCTLVSPQANDLVAQMRDKAIDEVIAKISVLCPEIVILEQ